MQAVKRGRVDRLLQVRQAEVHQVEEEVQAPLVLLVAARCAECDPPSVRELRQRGSQSRTGALARRQGVGVLWVQHEHLAARADGEAELRDDGGGGDPAPTRGGADEVSITVDRVQVSGIAAASEGGERLRLDRLGRRWAQERPTGGKLTQARPQLEGCAFGIHELATRFGVTLRKQLRERDLREARIAVARLAVREGELRTLDPGMQRVDCLESHRAQLESLQQPQLLQEDRTLAPGRALEDARAAVADCKRLLDRSLVAGQILRREQSRVRAPADVAEFLLEEFLDLFGGTSLVKRVARGADPLLARARAGSLRAYELRQQLRVGRVGLRLPDSS